MSRKWLVAHDFSDLAKLALERAAEQLAALGPDAELFILHVHAPMMTGFGIDLGANTAFQDADRALDKEARLRLDELAKGLAEQYPTLAVAIGVETGNPANLIVEVARREAADQIVLGSHGRRGLERFFLGSVAERVLRLSDRTVLIVKTPTTEANP